MTNLLTTLRHPFLLRSILLPGVLVFGWVYLAGRVAPGRDDTAWAHWALMASTVLPAIAMLLLPGPAAPKARPLAQSWLRGWWLPLLGLLLPVSLWPLAASLFESMPVGLSFGDVIPQIEVMNRRLLAGSDPYAPIWNFGYEIRTPYLPLHWMPFSLAAWLGFDPRWVSFAGWVLASGVFGLVLRALRLPWPIALISAALPAVYLALLIVFRPVLLGATVELLICAYTLVFAAGLLLARPLVHAAGWLPLLLSRYGAVLFFPVWFRATWLRHGRAAAFRGAAVVGLGIGLLFVVPFWLQRPRLLGDGLAYHDFVLTKRWVNPRFHGANGKPSLLYEGIGWARFVYELAPDDPPATLRWMKAGYAASALLVSFGLLWMGSVNKWRRPGFRVGALLLCLSAFYHGLPLPIDYYFSALGCVLLAAIPAGWLANEADDDG